MDAIVTQLTQLSEWTQGAVDGLLDPWQWEAVLRMAACAVIGTVIGTEREMHGRPAGVRTHLLLCLGCGIVMIASNHFARAYADLTAENVVRLDPARLAYGVVAGIGFLGAGVIMKQGLKAHGLTTAATIWVTAALGLSMGMGMYAVAVCGTVMTMFGLTAMHGLDKLLPSHHYLKLHVSHEGQDGDDCAVQEAIEAGGGKVLSVSIDWSHDNGVTATYVVRIATKDPKSVRQAVWEGVAAHCKNAKRVRLE